MANLVAKHFRPELLLADMDGFSEQDVVVQVREVVRRDALTAMGVAMFKRRLSDASDKELAQDKKTARRIAHALNSVVEPMHWVEFRSMASWDPDVRRRAAVVKWAEWLPEVDFRLDEQLAFCSTWVMRVNLSSMQVRRIIRRLDQARKHIK